MGRSLFDRGYAHASAGNISARLVALSLQGVWRPDCVLPPITPYQVMKVGPVPLVAGDVPGAKRVAQAVAGLIRERPIRGVLLERLGPVVWHTSPESASNLLEELEETARLWLMAQGRVEPLDSAQLAGLREAFGVEWPDGGANPPSFPAARDGGS